MQIILITEVCNQAHPPSFIILVLIFFTQTFNYRDYYYVTLCILFVEFYHKAIALSVTKSCTRFCSP